MRELALRVDGLTYLYDSGSGIRDLSFQVRSGEVFGLIGRNGAGKTTTILALMGVIKPDAGHLQILDFSGKCTPVSLRANIGYVPQRHEFYPWMRVDDLSRFASKFFPKWSNERFLHLVERLDIDKTKPFRHLSHGTLVKLSFALACSHGAELLILDEPTVGVDMPTRRQILDFINTEAEETGASVLLCSHIAEDIERTCQRVAIIERGTSILQSSFEELKEQYPNKGLEDIFINLAGFDQRAEKQHE